MKKELLYLLTGLVLAVPAAAQEQSPLSISAMGHLGASGNRGMLHSAQVQISYQRNRFSLSTGLSYFTSGHEREYTEMLPGNLYPNVPFEQLTFRHLMVPLTLSYHAPMGSRVEFIPSIGVGASYNPSLSYHAQSSDSSFYRHDFSSEEFGRTFRKVSFWGIASIGFSLKVSEPVALLANIEARGMLNDIYKSGIASGEHNIGLYFGLGGRYRF